jgi:predicted SnoaL-like aldol condensation-catalyzing enzyme
MSVEQDDKAIVRGYFEEVFNGGNLDVADKLFDPEHQLHNAYVPGVRRGPNTMKGVVWVFHKILPNLEAAVDDEIAENGNVVIRWALRGRLADELQTADVDEEVTVAGIIVSRVSDGKIKESWLWFDADPDESQRPAPTDEMREWLLAGTSTVREARSMVPFDLGEDCPECMRLCCLFRICCGN